MLWFRAITKGEGRVENQGRNGRLEVIGGS